MSKMRITRTNTKALTALGRVLGSRPCYWSYFHNIEATKT